MHDRQAALEPRRLGNGYMVAEGGNLVADTLKGVAVPTTVDNKATCYGIALGLVADEFDVHIFLVFSYVASRGCALLAGGVGFAEATSLAIAVFVIDPYQTAAEGKYFAKGDENRVMYLSQWWNHKPRY